MTELLPITGGEPDRDEPLPDESDNWDSDQQLDEDGAWAADQLRAYQLAFHFIDEEDAAAVGEGARFTMAPEALGLACQVSLLPGLKLPPMGKAKPAAEVPPPFILTISPERARATTKVGGLTAEVSVPLVRKSAVRSSGISLAVNPRHLSRLYAGKGRSRFEWNSSDHASFAFALPAVGQHLGTLTLDTARHHSSYDAEEVATEPPLPMLDALSELAPDSVKALARGLVQAGNLPRHLHGGLIIVKDGVALGAGPWHIIEYREPGLNQFDLAVSLADARPLKAMLTRFGPAVRQWKLKDRLLLSDGLMSCSVTVSDGRIPGFNVPRQNALEGLKVSTSTHQLYTALNQVGSHTLEKDLLVRFEIGDDHGVPCLNVTSRSHNSKGEVRLASLAGRGEIVLADNCYLDLISLLHAVQPDKFDAAEIYIGSHAAMIIQYRGDTSLTQIFAYRPAEA